MQEWVTEHVLWIKAFHIIAVMSWMAGMLYLPRLFVYHTYKAPGSEASEMLKVMEYRLMRYIINPAMITAVLLGGLLLTQPGIMSQGWLHAKLGLLFFMFAFHGMLSRWRKDFARDANTKSAKFFRIANEIPTILMIGIVIFAVVKPF